MNILDLPDDKIYEICEKLDDDSLFNFMETSRKIKYICNPIWKNREKLLELFYRKLIHQLFIISEIKQYEVSWLKLDNIYYHTVGELYDQISKLRRILYEHPEGNLYFDKFDKLFSKVNDLENARSEEEFKKLKTLQKKFISIWNKFSTIFPSITESLPEKQIYQICEKLDETSLRKLSQTSSKLYKVCNPLLKNYKKPFYDRLIKILFTLSEVEFEDGKNWFSLNDISSYEENYMYDKTSDFDYDMNQLFEEYPDEAVKFIPIFRKMEEIDAWLYRPDKLLQYKILLIKMLNLAQRENLKLMYD